MKEHKPPTKIDGIPVESCDDAITVRGQRWITLLPADESIDRYWEFSLSTGRLIESDT